MTDHQPPPPPPGAQPLSEPAPRPKKSKRDIFIAIGLTGAVLAGVVVFGIMSSEIDDQTAERERRSTVEVVECNRWRETLDDYRDGLEDELGLRVRARLTGQRVDNENIRRAAARASDDEILTNIESAIRAMEAACRPHR